MKIGTKVRVKSSYTYGGNAGRIGKIIAFGNQIYNAKYRTYAQVRFLDVGIKYFWLNDIKPLVTKKKFKFSAWK